MSEKTVTRLAAIVTLIALISIVLHVIAALSSGPWDDALMFVRYADHLLAGRGISWNGAPAFGLTSQAMLLLSVPLAALIKNPILVAMLSSLIGAVIFLGLIPLLVMHAMPGAARTVRFVAIAFSYACIALAYASFAPLAVSGMDTMPASAYLALYLSLALSFGLSDTAVRHRSIALGLIGGIAYLVRPDLVVFAVIVPFACALYLPSREGRRAAWLSLLISVAIGAASLVCLWFYYGTALPLPFYAKTGSFYGPVTAQRFAFVPVLEFIAFIDAYKFLFLAAITFGWALRKNFFVRSRDAVWIGVIGSAAISIAYFLVMVLQIMPYDGRFYYPALPALIALSCALIARIYRSPMVSNDHQSRMMFSVALLLVFFAALFTPLFSGIEVASDVLIHAKSSLSAYAPESSPFVYYASFQDGAIWPCLYIFSTMADASSLATTEVGFPGAAFPNRTIIDLSALNDSDLALRHSTLVGEILATAPDLVYLPTEHFYPSLYADLADSSVFLQHYEVLSSSELGSLSDVAIMKSSPSAAILGRCLNAYAKVHEGTTPVSDTGSAAYYLPLPYPLSP